MDSAKQLKYIDVMYAHPLRDRLTEQLHPFGHFLIVLSAEL